MSHSPLTFLDNLAHVAFALALAWMVARGPTDPPTGTNAQLSFPFMHEERKA